MCGSFILIRGPDGEMFPFIKDERGVHVIGQAADLHVLGDELHGDVIAYAVDGDGGVLPYFAGGAV